MFTYPGIWQHIEGKDRQHTQIIEVNGNDTLGGVYLYIMWHDIKFYIPTPVIPEIKHFKVKDPIIE